MWFGLARIFLFLMAVDGTSNFSGTWKMDPARSESAHQAVPIGTVTVVIEQTEFELKMETRRGKTDKMPASMESYVYRLDGSDYTVAGKDDKPVRTKTRWEGDALVLETEREVQNSSVTTRNILHLNGSGTELTMDRKLTVQHGYQGEGAKSYGTGTDVFTKVLAKR